MTFKRLLNGQIFQENEHDGSLLLLLICSSRGPQF